MNNSNVYIFNLIVQAAEFMNNEEKESEAELEAIKQADNELLRRIYQYEQQLESLHNIFLEHLATFIMQSSLHIRIINQDIFYEIFSGSLIFIHYTPRPLPAYETHPYWTTEHPSLSDHSSSS